MDGHRWWQAPQSIRPPAIARVRVPGKVNLALCVGKKSGAFHPLRTVFQALNLTDDVQASELDDGEITVEIRGPQAELVPTDGTDLCARAAKLLRARYGAPQLGAYIRVDKQIPVAGGMAGGSADAAGTLLALSRIWEIGLPDPELHQLAAELGSDVPFSLAGGVCLAQGRGTELMPLLTRGRYHWAVAFADHGLSTPEVYARFDKTTVKGTPDVPRALIDALIAGDAHALGATLINDLEVPALDLYPELANTLATGRNLPGVIAGLMSGSGPTCVFLCEDEATVPGVVEALAKLPYVRAARGTFGPVPGARFISPEVDVA
ncbi:MAG: 4-(cytidine 5'-diphospho)-2-C-methyl-D-erythritol kinase [Propionibacteriaceae bacterium]|jgi:4-diphosphocytidyl-2-C-methyl-D-erythritol kinase|nr:4-(cytidine 5'-diphospho)-2-C-methyl-D-erythritol kinase [Propionibacteriaceae bacterium]